METTQCSVGLGKVWQLLLVTLLCCPCFSRKGKGSSSNVAREPHCPVPVPLAEGKRPDLLFKGLRGGERLKLGRGGVFPRGV